MATNTPKLGLVNPEKGKGEKYNLALWTENNNKIDQFAEEASAQLAETGNRIDNIIATPIDLPEIYVDEIHDARQGKGSIGANITEIKSQLAEAEKVQNFKIKNEVINGSFENSTNGWKSNTLIDFPPDFTLDNTKSKVGVISAKLTSDNDQKSSIQEINCEVGDKIYYRAWVNRESGSDFLLYALPKGSISGSLNIAMSDIDFNALTANLWTAFSGIAIANNQGLRIAFGRLLATTAIANFDGFLAINLTTTFGAGNEPTKLEMDELLKVIPNGWWDGELTLTQKQVVTWQLNLIRKNTNAIIALGGTII